MLSAIEAIKAVKRIDIPTRSGVTFFSGSDIWLYQLNEIPTTCEECKNYADMASAMGGLNGNYIRSLFPYLMILDEDTIGGQGEGGKGLVHPHCGCLLVRFLGDPAESVPAQKRLNQEEEKKE